MSDKPASPARGRKKTAPPAQQPPQEEVVVRLPLTDLHPFPDHPFQVRDDEEMRETIQSVKEYGVIVPAIVRPREEGGYEIVAGHRRKYACEQAGLDTMPVLIRNLDRDAATIIMVDSNLQRENITENAAKYCRLVYEAGFSPVCPLLFLPLFLKDSIPQEHKDGIDMARDYLRRASVLVVCGGTVDEAMKNDIAVAERLRITATTLDGILTVKGQGREDGGKMGA